MRTLTALVAIVVALAIAPLASGGGWASVGFSPLPDGTSSGGTWSPTIVIKQHGVTPLQGLQPVVEIYDETGAATTAGARETSEPGVYTADVVFPSEGEWRVVVSSGFADSHVTYGPFSVGPAAAPGGGSFELPAAGAGAVVLAVLAGLALLVGRRSRRLTPAS
jgi:hypothetical protein